MTLSSLGAATEKPVCDMANAARGLLEGVGFVNQSWVPARRNLRKKLFRK
jgi:hypothetical protein